jgi:hypothetical protein
VKPSPAPSPSPSPTPGPIAASVDRIVQEVLTSREAPCRRADRDGVPCFPVWVEVEGPRYSVAESLRRFRADDSPSPDRPPTVDESWRYRPGYSPHSADFGTVDPGCVAKSLIKGLKDKNDTYYLYRLRDRTGERPLLRDRPIDPKAFDAVPDVEYTFLGRFEGECKALAAYRHALRNPPPKAERDVPEGAGGPPP